MDSFSLGEVGQLAQPLVILFGVVGGGLLLLVILLMLCRYLANTVDKSEAVLGNLHNASWLQRATLRCARFAAYFWPNEEDLTVGSPGERNQLIVALKEEGVSSTAVPNAPVVTPVVSHSRRPSTLPFFKSKEDCDLVPVQGDNRKWLTADNAEAEDFFRRSSMEATPTVDVSLASPSSSLKVTPSPVKILSSSPVKRCSPSPIKHSPPSPVCLKQPAESYAIATPIVEVVHEEQKHHQEQEQDQQMTEESFLSPRIAIQYPSSDCLVSAGLTQYHHSSSAVDVTMAGQQQQQQSNFNDQGVYSQQSTLGFDSPTTHRQRAWSNLSGYFPISSSPPPPLSLQQAVAANRNAIVDDGRQGASATTAAYLGAESTANTNTNNNSGGRTGSAQVMSSSTADQALSPSTSCYQPAQTHASNPAPSAMPNSEHLQAQQQRNAQLSAATPPNSLHPPSASLRQQHVLNISKTPSFDYYGHPSARHHPRRLATQLHPNFASLAYSSGHQQHFPQYYLSTDRLYYNNPTSLMYGRGSTSSASAEPTDSASVILQSSSATRRSMFAQPGDSTNYDAWVSGESSPYQASLDWGMSWHPANSPYLSPPQAYNSPDIASLGSSSFDVNEQAYDMTSPSNAQRLLDLRGHRSHDCGIDPSMYPDMAQMGDYQYFYRQARSYEEEGTVIDLSTKCRDIQISDKPLELSKKFQLLKEEDKAQATDTSDQGESRCPASIEVCRELWQIRSNFAEKSDETGETDTNAEVGTETPPMANGSTLLQIPGSGEPSKRPQTLRRLWSSSRANANNHVPEASFDSIDGSSLSERGYEGTATSFDSESTKPAEVESEVLMTSGQSKPTARSMMKKTNDSGYTSISVEHHQQLAVSSSLPKAKSMLDDILSNSETSEGPSCGGASGKLSSEGVNPLEKVLLKRQEPLVTQPSEPTTRLRIDKLGQKQDSFDDPNMPYYITKPAVFAKILRMKTTQQQQQHQQQQNQAQPLHQHQTSLSRDYSIDERTNKIFNDFVKFDPSYERRSSLSSGAPPHRTAYRPHTLRLRERHQRHRNHFSAEDMTSLGISPKQTHRRVIEAAPSTASSVPAAEPMMTMSWATQGAIEEEPQHALSSQILHSAPSLKGQAPWFITAKDPMDRRRSSDFNELSSSRRHRPYIERPSMSQPQRPPNLRQQSLQASPTHRNIPVICLPTGEKLS